MGVGAKLHRVNIMRKIMVPALLLPMHDITPTSMEGLFDPGISLQVSTDQTNGLQTSEIQLRKCKCAFGSASNKQTI